MTLEVVHDLAGLRRRIADWRAMGARVAFVPTMGNLHAGHLSLLERAREGHCRCVVSIYVNPAQFGPGEDFEAYPRTLDADCALLAEHGCELVWAPDDAVMYPGGVQSALKIPVPRGLAGQLCGAFRPGHFEGVATVVLRLFNQVQPDRAVFGEKDYQQLLVIRWLARELSLAVEIDQVPTARETDGLAMSSRNRYLTADQRPRATAVYDILQSIAMALRAGQGDFSGLEQAGMQRLGESGLKPEYVAIRRAEDLGPPGDGALRVLAAAWLGKARLIDNVPV